MRPGDASDGEMRRYSRNPVAPLDPAMVERILDGSVHEDDVPPDYRDVLRVLAAAAAPVAPVPSAEAAALAAFRSTRRPVDPPRRKSVFSKLLGAKALVALVLGTATVGTAAAAATGTLPDSAQATAHRLIAAVPDADSAGQAADVAAGAGDHATLPGAAGLCQAYASGSSGENGRRLDSAGFKRLSDAAGGTDKIDAYCGTVTAAAKRAAGSAATGQREALVGACRAWLAADQQSRTDTLAKAVVGRLTTAAGSADGIAPYCTELVGQDQAAPAASAAAPSATPEAKARITPPAKGPGEAVPSGLSTPSHPAPPTPRG